MNKENSFNKKLIATSVAASLFVGSLGTMSCFANDKVDAGAQINEYVSVETQVNAKDLLENVPIESKKDYTELEKQPLEKNTSIKENNKIEEKQTKKSKKEIAKTVAKVVAAAAIIGASAYVGYKYKDSIAGNLNAVGNYMKDNMKLVAEKTANYTKNTYNKLSDNVNALKYYIGNKLGSLKNVINKSQDSINLPDKGITSMKVPENLTNNDANISLVEMPEQLNLNSAVTKSTALVEVPGQSDKDNDLLKFVTKNAKKVFEKERVELDNNVKPIAIQGKYDRLEDETNWLLNLNENRKGLNKSVNTRNYIIDNSEKADVLKQFVNKVWQGIKEPFTYVCNDFTHVCVKQK